MKYTRVGIASKDMLAPKGSSLDQAILVFKQFFHAKTGVEWKDRFDDSKFLLGFQASANEESSLQPPKGGWFRYERPGGLMSALSKDMESAADNEVQEEAFAETKAMDAGDNKSNDTAPVDTL